MPGRPGSPEKRSRGRLAWGWRLAAYVALVLTLLSLAEGLAAGALGAAAGELSLGTVTAAAAAAMAASWVMMSAVESIAPASRRGLRDFALGCTVGLVLMTSVGAALAGARWLWLYPAWSGWSGTAGVSLYLTTLLLIAAFVEELLLRGYPFQVLAEAAGPHVAVGVTALVFAALHAGNPGTSPIALCNTFLAGILLGWMVWRTLSLWLVTGAHFAWNWVMGVGLGLPVSGIDLRSPILESRVVGPAWLTGGAYGPEGGLLLTAVALAGIAWTARTPRLSPDPGVLALGPLPASRLEVPRSGTEETEDSRRS